MELNMKKLLNSVEEKIDPSSIKLHTFNEIIGRTFSTAKVLNSDENDDKIDVDIYIEDVDKFVLENNDCIFLLYHDQKCCENVHIESVDGDLNDLVGSPILEAESVSGEVKYDEDDDDYFGEDMKYTFFKFSTLKGSVVIRWNGSSNGYYSINVDDYFKLKS